ncbi:MAG: hypothetical protein ACR2QC_05310 [Gammaproteobacteria bacterium]
MEWAIGAMVIALGATIEIRRMMESLRKDFREEIRRSGESLCAEMNRGFDRLHNDIESLRRQMAAMAEKLGATTARSE